MEQQDRKASGSKIVTMADLILKDGSWGYIINGVGIILSGLQTVAGAGIMLASAPTANAIGFAFGGMLVLHGMNGMQESYKKLRSNAENPDGFLKNDYISTAKFLGFDSRTGRLAYNHMDLALSGYGMLKLTLKPQAWRLFYFIRSDYIRNVQTMSKAELAIEIYQDYSTIRSIQETK